MQGRPGRASDSVAGESSGLARMFLIAPLSNFWTPPLQSTTLPFHLLLRVADKRGLPRAGLVGQPFGPDRRRRRPRRNFVRQARGEAIGPSPWTVQVRHGGVGIRELRRA